MDRWCKGDGGIREVALLGGMFRISKGVMVLVVALCISFDVFFLILIYHTCPYKQNIYCFAFSLSSFFVLACEEEQERERYRDR